MQRANLGIVAYANGGRGTVPKLILNPVNDSTGEPTGGHGCDDTTWAWIPGE